MANSDDVKTKLKGFLSFPILRDILIILFLVIVVWKLFNSSLNLDFSNFDFNNLLSLILAIFAISLSAAFYFKATETSYRFYDNVYNFTKDTSEILGRIEAGFGERLRHIDEGYTSVRAKIRKIS